MNVGNVLILDSKLWKDFSEFILAVIVMNRRK